MVAKSNAAPAPTPPAPATRIPDFRDWPTYESTAGDLTTFGTPLRSGQ